MSKISVVLFPEENASGNMRYYPGNSFSVNLVALLRKMTFSDADLPLIEACGFDVVLSNGNRIFETKNINIIV